MLEKFMSSVGVGVAKVVTAFSACANAVVCYFAKMAIDSNTRVFLMAIAASLLLVMLASFVVVSKNIIAMFRDEAQNGVHIAA